jgi:hypothetical protein
MDVALLFPNNYIAAAEFGGREVTYTIVRVKVDDLEQMNGGKKKKGIVVVQETEKAWVLNRTNAECMKAMWGRETDAWIGKRVTLWPAPFTDNETGEVKPAIRIRGSPDLDKPITFELKLPRKKPVTLTMQVTGKAAPKANGKAPPNPVKARVVEFWKKAQAAGKSEDEFKTWMKNVLGGAKASSAVTNEEADQLENALPDLLGQVPEADAPGDEEEVPV